MSKAQFQLPIPDNDTVKSRAHAFGRYELNRAGSATVWAIDPGTTHSGVVLLNGKEVVSADAQMENATLVRYLELHTEPDEQMAIEMIASYGMPVGKSTFETVVWIGRFIQAFGAGRSTLIYRQDCKRYLCDGNMRAKDANVRQAIMDRYPATGGGAKPVIGTKAKPGPLFGVSSHAWAALAVGLTYQSGEYGEAVQG